jgi:nucleotide-binding universal stress UspA family protein
MSEILVGVDGTALAEVPLAFAERLAAGSGATLRMAMAYPCGRWTHSGGDRNFGQPGSVTWRWLPISRASASHAVSSPSTSCSA